MIQLDLNAYAKINLSIDVLGKLPSGYHEVSMVMQQIELHDKICVRWLPGQSRKEDARITLELNSNKRFLPKDERNLAYKAAQLMIKHFDIYQKFGSGKVRIDIKKQIPVGAGLGGGSADCAAVIHALSKIWKLGQSTQELCSLGATLGADVPFCIMGQAGETAAHAEGVGTKLTQVRGINSWVVLTKPPVSVSTAEVYKGFSLIKDKNFERPDTKQLISAMHEKNCDLIKKNIINVLENFTLKAYANVMYTKNKMITETSPIKAVMSGSGPTIIGFYEDRESAETAYGKMALLNKETFLTKTLTNDNNTDSRGKAYVEF
jgi:4-diphosphocytidyl-2-C-methyl-D-erythritol kinase